MSEGSDAAVELGVSELKIGEQEISAEAVTRGGKVLGRRTLKFTRLTERVRRAVYIDRYKRVIVREKPFFPVGIYCSRAESNIIERIGKAPFNAVMAYGGLDLPMLDWCRKNGLMASGYVGDLQYLDASVAARVAKVKDHPAVLAWLMNDERPLSMLPQLHSRNRAIREADPDHPTWAVLYQIDQLRGYTGTCDAIGTDPYPLPHTSVAVAHRWAEKSRKAVFDAVPVWQTIQVFDWAAYKTKAVPGTDVSKYRAPTSAELKFMAWAQVVNGAKAIFMYAYDPLVKMDWRDPFEKRWREVCDCAEEIVSVSDILLSVEPAPALDRLPQGLAARVWRIGGKVHLLVCNATGKNLKTSIPLGSAFSGAMRTVFGGGVKREGGALAVDFPVEGYAFLSFGGCSVP